MANAYYGSRISNNLIKTPEGYLICKNVPVARTGIQQYLGEEFGADPADRLFNVNRPEAEVFSKIAIASFEGKPVVDDHPDEDVSPDNYRRYMKGVCRDVRRGDGEFKNCLVADLIIYDAELIKKIEQGKREISCGYDCYWNPTSDTSYDQLKIRGNHIAVVDNGRAGHGVCIRDSAAKIKERGTRPMSNKDTLWGKLLSAFAKDAETSPEDLVAAAKLAGGAEAAPQPKPVPAPVQPAPVAAAPAAPAAPAPVPAKPAMDAEIDARFKRIEDALAGIQAKMAPAPAAPAAPAPAAPQAPAAPKPQAKDENVPEETALDALEGELEGEEPACDSAVEEAAVEADPKAINAAYDEDVPAEIDEGACDEDIPGECEGGACDEDLVVEEGSEQFSQATKDSARKIIASFKPLIASIPNAEQRRKAADSLAILIRGNMQADAQYGEVQRITRAQRAHDKKISDADYGRMIRDKFNPHYKK